MKNKTSCSSEKYHRRSIRLKDYDYSQTGAYFITICTNNNKCIFGSVEDGAMRLNKYGVIVKNEWLKTAELRLNVVLDEYVVIPNHFYGIIMVVDDCRGTARRAPTVERFSKPVPNSLPTIVRSFKSAVTKRINEMRGKCEIPIWQRNYYEHVIRNEDKLNEIRQYIQNNPLGWHLDWENPERVGKDELEEEIFRSKKAHKVNK